VCAHVLENNKNRYIYLFIDFFNAHANTLKYQKLKKKKHNKTSNIEKAMFYFSFNNIVF